MKKQLITVTAVSALGLMFASSASAHYDYTVEKGDTLWKIADEQKVTVDYLMNWNNLVSDLIVPGQKIRIEEGPFHTVVRGDSLSRIAAQHEITVNELMSWNNLTNETLTVGQVLNTVEHKFHTVKKGDTLSEIAVANNITLSNLMRWNKLTNSLILPGQTLIVKNSSEVESEVVFNVRSSAFTAQSEGFSGVTYTGLDLKANPSLKVVSVDPTVIPLGSKVWVEGYGEAIAAHTDASITGYEIGVFIPNEPEATLWGEKRVKIKIITE